MNRVFFFFSSNNIGGAEKRILGLWIHLKEKNNVHLKLLLSQQLYDTIRRINELENIDKYKDDIIIEGVNTENVFAYSKSIKAISEKYFKLSDIIHFVSSFPFFIKIKSKTIFTFTESSLANVNLKGKIGYFLSFLQADLIDVLDPLVYKQLGRVFFLRRKICMTSNSYVDLKVLPDINFSIKKNQVIHLGRFVKGKQIEELILALPAIDSYLKSRNISDVEYIIIGYGTLEHHFKSLLSGKAYKSINCKLIFTANPYQVLQKSKVILSIQEKNNYPSKALLEGIVCGNIPIVTDVGTTKYIAPPEFSYYINKDFSNQELADKIYKVLTLSDENFKARANKGINYVKNNFTIEKMAEYYLKLYKRINI